MRSEEIKEVRIFEERKDSVEIRELASGELKFTIKVHGEAGDNTFIEKINNLKERVEKEVLKR